MSSAQLCFYNCIHLMKHKEKHRLLLLNAVLKSVMYVSSSLVNNL